MKHNTTNLGGGLKPYLRPELEMAEIAVETGFVTSQEVPGGVAKPFDAWGDRMFDAWGDAIEEQ